MEFMERSIETVMHGRYLVHGTKPGAPMLVGFHGYAESADMQMDRMRSVPGAEDWLIVSIQGLHRFYRGRTNDVVASWMTRQNRELAIADNMTYVERVVGAVAKEHSASGKMVFTGFSQGVAMAFRAAARSNSAAVLALGGDIPPELDVAALARIRMVQIGRGTRDEWYTAEKMASDESRLREAGTHLQVTSFDAGHEWNAEFSNIAGKFLRSIVL
jgi:predicted esterase